jgi:3',5'-cyclic AMP phosphodiesterase CpdA
MPTLVHASDVHFGKPHLPHVAEAFLEAAHAAAPDVIVVSGDLTQRAKPEEFQAAAAWLERLSVGPGRGTSGRVPVVVTPGNHDVPLYRVAERVRDPFMNYRRFISPELNTVTRVPGLTLVALNSAAPRRAIVNGRLDDAQLRFAEEAFAASPGGDLRIVVAHHHLAPAPDYQGDTPLPRARAILERLKGMDVEMVLGGHLHRAYIVNSLDVYPGEDREHGVVVVHSGTTTSARGRARERLRNSFNVIHVEPDHLDIRHHLYHGDEDRFLPLSRHVFPRRPALSLPEEATTAPAAPAAAPPPAPAAPLRAEAERTRGT